MQNDSNTDIFVKQTSKSTQNWCGDWLKNICSMEYILMRKKCIIYCHKNHPNKDIILIINNLPS